MIPEDAIWILELIRNRDARTEAEKDAVNAAIEALKAQLSQEGKTKGTTSDLISRQQAIDAADSETVSTNPEHFKSSEKFIKFMDDDDIASFGRWQWANGFNTALVATKVQLEKLPSVQPEPKWIPVSERLPEDMQFVLLTVRRLKAEYNHEPFISVGYIGWNQHHWWCAHDGDCEISNVEVLAWMPLPEAYKPNK